MKKIILLTTLLLSYATVKAQSVRLFAYEATISIDGVKPVTVDASYEITLDIGEMKVKFQTNPPVNFILLKSVEQWTDEHGGTNIKYKALDFNNEPCFLILLKYKKSVNIVVDYGEIIHLYKTRIME